MKKAALHNLGCKVNSYETEAMQQLLQQNGYEIVPFTEQADVYIINTCSVTNMADKKSRQMIHRARKLNPEGIVVAAGCYVQTSQEEAQKDDAIDILIGNNKKHELLSLLEEFEKNRNQKKKTEEITEIQKETGYEEFFLTSTSEHTRAFIKIQDGCNQFCSYCIIPYARGPVRSRKKQEILEEITTLAKNGYKEVVLTGIHLSSYGTDTGDNLLEIIQEINKIQGIERIRLGSLEPKIVTETFALELSKLSKVCPHFHLSLQSGCDETLKRMNRKYTCEEYEKGCEYLRKYFPNPGITTDVIVGFPGETEEEFLQTRKFLEKIAFFQVHIFKYSPRKGTKAARMEHQISQQVKTERSNLLLQVTEKMKQEFLQQYQGCRVKVLLEETVESQGEVYALGHTPEYIKVAVKGKESLVNRILEVTLTCEILPEFDSVLGEEIP